MIIRTERGKTNVEFALMRDDLRADMQEFVTGLAAELAGGPDGVR